MWDNTQSLTVDKNESFSRVRYTFAVGDSTYVSNFMIFLFNFPHNQSCIMRIHNIFIREEFLAVFRPLIRHRWISGAFTFQIASFTTFCCCILRLFCDSWFFYKNTTEKLSVICESQTLTCCNLLFLNYLTANCI